MVELRSKLKIQEQNLEEVNRFLGAKNNPLVDALLNIVDKYGGVDEINRRAMDARKVENLMARLERKKSPFLKDLEWLMKQRDKDEFISISKYRRKVLGKKANSAEFDE